MRNWNFGQPDAMRRRSPPFWTLASLLKFHGHLERRGERSPPAMLATFATPHQLPGTLIVVEGIDGSGKTTQLGLLAKWLSANGHRVFVTEWNSSALVKAATKSGKKEGALTPMTFSLLHATDFADRQLYQIIPPLKPGMVVLAGRHAYAAFARD